MRRAAAEPPRQPELPPDLEPGAIGALAHDTAYAECALTDLELPDQAARGVRLRAITFRRVDLSGSRLDHLTAGDVRLDGCNLANVHSRKADLGRLTVDRSRLTGIALPAAELHDLTIRDCRVDLASFGAARLARVTFEDCVLSQTDFLEAELQSVRFDRCDLTGSDFRGARLRRCEFRRCDLTGLQGVTSLRGAGMEWPDIVEQAGVWAAALGIEVLDAD